MNIDNSFITRCSLYGYKIAFHVFMKTMAKNL